MSGSSRENISLSILSYKGTEVELSSTASKRRKLVRVQRAQVAARVEFAIVR